MQLLLQKIWERLLLPIPMPLQVVLVIFLVMPLAPLLILRCFPWLAIRLLQVALFFTELIAHSLCFLEYQITQSIRKRKGKPPEVLYILSDIAAGSVRLGQFLKLSAERLSSKTSRIPWRLRPIGWYALPLVFIPIWLIRPHLGNSSFATSIDSGVAWWCSLEHWIMAGEWKPSTLTCRYPNSTPRWHASLKVREYELKREIREYTEEIDAQRDRPTAYYNRGNAYLGLENIEAAFKDYTTSVQIDTAYAPGYSGRGDIYLMKGDKSGAFKEYSNAVNADPNYAPGYVGRGNVYLAMNDNASAFKEYSAATSADPNYAPSYVGRGDIYQRAGDKEAALREYKKAIQLDSNYALAYAKMGNLYHRNFNNREAAIEVYKRAAESFLRSGQVDSYREITNLLSELSKHITHTVSPGDSLSKIAQRYGVSTRVIVSANKETYPALATNPNSLEVGWRLKIPQ